MKKGQQIIITEEDSSANAVQVRVVLTEADQEQDQEIEIRVLLLTETNQMTPGADVDPRPLDSHCQRDDNRVPVNRENFKDTMLEM